jgi:hypothetical protein
VVVGEPKDRDVGPDPAGLVEELGVDEPPGRDVHLGDGEALHRGHGARPGDVEDRKGGVLDHPCPIAQRQVLGVDER